MKKKGLLLILMLFVSCALSACDEYGPYYDTETESQTEVSSEKVESNDTKFYASEVFFYKVSQESYEQHLTEGHVVGLLTSKEEWEQWMWKNMPNENMPNADAEPVFKNYKEALFEHNYLLIYQCGLEERGLFASDIEHIYIEDNEIRVKTSTDAENAILDDVDDNYYIPYQICWIKKQEVTEQVCEKYNIKHYYCMSKENAYYVYMNLLASQVEVEYTQDGGKTWKNYTYRTDEVWGNGDVYASFIDEHTAYILSVLDNGLGYAPKILYYMGDTDRYIQEVGYLTTDIDNYPVGMDFCNKEVGYIITNYRNTQDFLYRTEDGGQTWVVQTVPEPEYEYSYMQGVRIECISETEARVVVEVVTAKGAHQLEYVTKDGGKTWHEPLYMYNDESVEN